MMICDFESPHALLLSFNKMCWFKNRPQARLYVLGTGYWQVNPKKQIPLSMGEIVKVLILKEVFFGNVWWFDEKIGI